MRRGVLVAALSLMLVTLVGGTVSAHVEAVTGPHRRSAPCRHGQQGGSLRVDGVVVGRNGRTAFSASAVVHFASGDVSVPLQTKADRWRHGHHARVQFRHRRGQPLLARAWVPVSATETGQVPVDVTIVYGRRIVAIRTFGIDRRNGDGPRRRGRSRIG